jgi:hypothetical protein
VCDSGPLDQTKKIENKDNNNNNNYNNNNTFFLKKKKKEEKEPKVGGSAPLQLILTNKIKWT